jgi:hypothetical protein
LAVFIAVFSVIADARAQELNRVVFNGWTRMLGQPSGSIKQMVFYITVDLNPVAHPPDFVKHIKITAPDESVFYLYPDKDWLQSDHGFWKAYLATDFKSGLIPGGIYKAAVVPVSGTGITETDDIPATFLGLPNIVYPAEGETGVSTTPTITWKAVSGATYYRVVLWNDIWGEPVYHYYDPRNNFQTDRTYAKIPKGALKANTRYRLQIQARSDSLDIDRRSQTSWRYFTTGNW